MFMSMSMQNYYHFHHPNNHQNCSRSFFWRAHRYSHYWYQWLSSWFYLIFTSSIVLPWIFTYCLHIFYPFYHYYYLNYLYYFINHSFINSTPYFYLMYLHSNLSLNFGIFYYYHHHHCYDYLRLYLLRYSIFY